MDTKRKVGTLKSRLKTGEASTDAPQGSELVTTTYAQGKTRGAALSDDRKGQLLEEAARLFGARGYDRTSMRDIAAAFGILPGSLYHHFGSKENSLPLCTPKG